jgi:hypothetical protein
MYIIDLVQYKSQFHYDFNVSPGNEGSPITYLMAPQPLWALAAFQSPDLFTIGRTPWMSDQLVARSVP